MVWKLVLLFLAGGLGTLARYGLAGAVQRLAGGAFPLGEVYLQPERELLTPEARLLVLTGFMGAFTTFSTWMFESGQLLQESQHLALAGNLLGQVAVGMLFLFLGFALGRAI